ncbi:MAG: hypothetical protein ABNH26_06125 [Celeribacter sp.]|jgi:hypothetical protein
MKPRFALDLRNDEIALLHRSRAGWLPVGSVRFDAPDLEAQLEQLRDTAAQLEPAGLTVKLVLPDAQVLYTETAARGGDADEDSVRQALQGATPYRVEDLAYDWQADALNPQTLRIAVVARVTLDEAESFAAAHGFVPLSFVAAPEGGTYPGEPFFGPAKTAEAQLAEGDMIERDAEVLSVTGASAGADTEAGVSTSDLDPETTAASEVPETAHDGAETAAVPAEPELAEEAAPSPVTESVAASQSAPIDEESQDPGPLVEPERELAESEVAEPELAEPATPFETADHARDLWAELDNPQSAEDDAAIADAPGNEASDTTAPDGTGDTPDTQSVDADSEVLSETSAETLAPPTDFAPVPTPDADSDTPLESLTSDTPDDQADTPAETATPDAAKVVPVVPIEPAPAITETPPVIPQSDSGQTIPPAPAVTFHSLRASRTEGGRMALPGTNADPDADSGTPQDAAPHASGDTAPRHNPSRPSVGTPHASDTARSSKLAAPIGGADGNKASPEAMARADRAALAAAAGFAAGAGRKAQTGRMASLRRRFGKADAPAPRAVQPPLDDSAGPVIGTPARAKRPAAAGPIPETNPAAFSPGLTAGTGGASVKSAGAAPAKSGAATAVSTTPASGGEATPEATQAQGATSKTGASEAGKSVFGARSAPRRSGRGLLAALAACLVAALLLVALWAGVLGEDERIAAVPPQAEAPAILDDGADEDSLDVASSDPLPDGINDAPLATTAPDIAGSDADLADPSGTDLAGADQPISPLPTLPDGTAVTDGGTSRVSDSLTADDLGVATDSQPERQAPGSRSDADLADINDPDLVGAPTEAELAARDVPDLPEAQRAYAATGIWQRPPERAAEPDDAPVDNAYLAAIDPSVGAHDAVALPPVQADVPMALPSDPAAPDQSFALDDAGRVAPSAQGTLSPEGVLIYSGSPAVTPPTRPGAEAIVPLDGVAATDGNATSPDADGPDADGLVAGDPSLPARRPIARPGDLGETAERTQLNGYTRDQLAGLQPRARPRSLQEAVAAATDDATDADASADPSDAVATAPDADMSDSALAVASSRQPRDRPSNIAQIVARTVAARPSQQAVAAAVASARQQAAVAPTATPAPAAAPARRAEPEEEDEPEPVAARNQTVQPNIPTRASVAASATVKNGIRMGEVTLIGVFGTASNRRALVRLPSGRYVKVGVGDRVDGGQVAAIGKSELRYVKNGRNLMLAMPSEG